MSVVVRPLAPGIPRRVAVGTGVGTPNASEAAAGLSASAWWRALSVVATSATGLALLSLLACSLFVRYTSHAFQMADLLHRSGFIGGQIAWYLGWTGRFAANATWLAAASAGPGLTRVMPTLALAGWGAALWFALPRVAAAAGRRLSGVSRLLSVEVVLLATLTVTPALWFDLYKMTGSITYISPLVLATVALGVGLGALTAGRLRTRQALALVGLGFVAAGFSDTFSAVQLVAIVLLATCALPLRDRSRRAAGLRAALMAASGAAVGLLLLVRAPGNSVRRSVYPATPHLATALGRAIGDSWQFLASSLTHSGLALLGVALAFAVIALASTPTGEARRGRPGLTLRRAAAMLAGTGVIIVVAHLPAEQMTSAAPPARSEIVPSYALVLAIAYLAWAAGVRVAVARPRLGAVRWRLRVPLVVATAAVLLVPVLTMTMVARNWESMAAYAAAEDRQWQQADRAPNGSDAVVDPLRTTGIGPLSHDPMQELQPDPSYWVNQVYAEYFGLRSVRVSTGEASLVR